MNLDNINDLIEPIYEVIIKGESEYYETKISSSLYHELYNYGCIIKDEYGNSIIKANIVRQGNLKFVVDYQNSSDNFPNENAINVIKELEEQLNRNYKDFTKWQDYIIFYNRPVDIYSELPKNYDKTKDSNCRNPIYYPKRKKHGKR